MSFAFDYRPSESSLVDAIWHTRTAQALRFISAAETRWEMVITTYQGKTNLTVRGPETQATPADSLPEMECFGIIFKVGTFMPHFPLLKLLDRNDSTLPEASHDSFYLHGSIWQLPTFENADGFIQKLEREDLLVQDAVVQSALQGRLPNLSLRSIQRRFLQVTGLSHNAIYQINRARQAMKLLQQGVSILDTVEEMGYADQPHLTRALKRYVGTTPTQVHSVQSNI